MKTMTKRLMSLLLAVVMLATMVVVQPITALAADTLTREYNQLTDSDYYNVRHYFKTDFINYEYQGVGKDGVMHICPGQDMKIVMNFGKFTDSEFNAAGSLLGWHFGNSDQFCVSTDKPFSLSGSVGDFDVSGFGSTNGSTSYVAKTSTDLTTTFTWGNDALKEGTYEFTVTYKLQMKQNEGWPIKSWKTKIETNGQETDTIKVVVGHDPERRGAKEKDCFTDGYTGDEYCKRCNEKLADGKTIPASHEYDPPKVEWAADNSTCTVSVLCPICGTNNGDTVTTEHIVTSYCDAEGSEDYVADFSGLGLGTQTNHIRDIAPIGHRYGTAKYTWTADENGGNPTCVGRAVCLNDGLHIKRETAEIQTVYSPDPNKTKAPTCTETGRVTYTATFNDRDYGTTQETFVIPAIKHNFSSPEYSWSDGYKKCTAVSVCSNCGETIEETVDAASKITKRASCTEMGETTYTATFTKGFETQIKTLQDIDMVAHRYDVTYVWPDNDVFNCTATAKCFSCGKIVTENAAVNEDLTTAPHTCTKDGTKIYTATFTNEIFTTQGKNIVWEKLGHDNETIPAENATCTTAGHSAYEKCKRCGEETNKTLIPALGHDYDETKPEQQEDKAYCGHDGKTAVFKCNRCNEEFGGEKIDMPAAEHDYSVVVDPAVKPTCGTDGKFAKMKCRVCGMIDPDSGKTDYSTGEHDYSIIVHDESTSLDTSKHGHKCSYCGKIDYETEVGCEAEPCIFAYTVKPATYVSVGEIRYTCVGEHGNDGCGYGYEMQIDKLEMPDPSARPQPSVSVMPTQPSTPTGQTNPSTPAGGQQSSGTTAAPTTSTTAPAKATTTKTTTAKTTTKKKVTTTASASQQLKKLGYTKTGGVWVDSKKGKKTTISKLKKAKKAFTVTVKKTSGIKGYQIQYSTDKKFKKSVKSKTLSTKKTSYKATKLKAKKTYYVRVRTYKNVKVNGKTYKVYSKWSAVKSVKTK